MPDQTLIITPEVLRQLSVLRSSSKFQKEWEHFYPGATNEDTRLAAEQAINAMLDRLPTGLRESPSKSYVLSEFLEMLEAFEPADSEEREQACNYCERVMKVLGIESSDGLLNTWLYGFDPEQKP
jgi:hypothetical protein